MSLYIYRKTASSGAADLAETLGAARYRGKIRPIEQKAKVNDAVVCWGEALPFITGVRILNGAPFRTKLEDAEVLRQAGVSTIEVSRTLPAPVVPQPAPPDPALQVVQDILNSVEDFVMPLNIRGQVFRDAIDELTDKFLVLRTTLQQAAPKATPAIKVTWLGRRMNHIGGNDLLNPTITPEFYSKKEDLVQEFRVHSFLGRSIRAGVKDLRDGFTQMATRPEVGETAHPWIRSWDGGWRIKYDGVTSKQKHRDLAHEAVKALGLDFGAVDIGKKADGTLIVLEVNRAPGLEGGTIDAYANAIQGWAEKEGIQF
jgi:hypothetical protein